MGVKTLGYPETRLRRSIGKRSLATSGFPLSHLSLLTSHFSLLPSHFPLLPSQLTHTEYRLPLKSWHQCCFRSNPCAFFVSRQSSYCWSPSFRPPPALLPVR